jgi:glutathione synthase/RimK-type ligase-like ATP-grasp enzyme
VIAIHYGKSPWSDRWIFYCNENNIDYLEVNIYQSDIVNHLKENSVTLLLAQPLLSDYKTNLIAKSILYCIEKMGIKVFPNYKAFWHYDDKLSQKYLFEALELPHAASRVIYSKKEALEWLSDVDLPVVFKLRGGASSSNVVLLRNKSEAKRYVNKMFGSGINPVRSVFNDLKTKARIHTNDRDWIQTIKKMPSTLRNIYYLKRIFPPEKGYMLVQEFQPGNDHDTRVFVMGDKAIAARRFVRPNDFRASGTGNLNADLDQSKIDKGAIALAFDASKKIGAYAMAYDIIYDRAGNPVIIEMSYTMPTHGDEIINIQGYWDDSIKFHPSVVRCEDFIISNLLEQPVIT